MDVFRKYRTKTLVSIILLLWSLCDVMFFDVISKTKTYLNAKYLNLYYSKVIEKNIEINVNRNTSEFGSLNNNSEKLKNIESVYIFNDYLINTSGCQIPDYSKSYKIKEADYIGRECGQRIIFANRTSANTITLFIDNTKMVKLVKRKTYLCCYRFVYTDSKYGATKIKYSSCRNFNDSTKIELKHEIIQVSCIMYCNKRTRYKANVIYADVYIFLKKRKKKILAKEYVGQAAERRWNVLIVGLDTMSRSRLYSSLPRVAKYLHKKEWLDYRGYQKVGSNTFPNVMSFLTGKKLSTIYDTCKGYMENCKDSMIWSHYSKAGYITAYGEEHLMLPDTFSNRGFRNQAIDHYLRPFFLTGEKTVGNLVCTKTKPSVFHVLDYATQFTNAYKDQPFFGIFWLNSCSHNLNNLPILLEEDLLDFFEKLYRNGITNNTFIIFLSDHGIRFGRNRIPVGSYYEERLPMLFMWTPPKFRELQAQKYNNSIVNQYRLSTPYNVFLYLRDILEISIGSSVINESEACPKCKSFFHVIPKNRTCGDVNVDDNWCSCHNMAVVDKLDVGVKESLQLAVSEIQRLAASVKTRPCFVCEDLKLKNVLRSHFYPDPINNETYYFIAFELSPGDISYEIKVKRDSENKFKLLSKTNCMSSHNSRGDCVYDSDDRSYCVCKKIYFNCK